MREDEDKDEIPEGFQEEQGGGREANDAASIAAKLPSLFQLVLFELSILSKRAPVDFPQLKIFFATLGHGKTPLRNLLVVGIDKLKRGRGPLVAKTVAATLLVVFSAILYSVMEIRKRALEAGVVNSTDEVLMAERLLEASLMGFSLFLAMMADRLHYHMKELYRLREEMEQ
ncbi:hypothetical protein GH714_024045 [Hevea brasiliensis]|uniref:Endoplasmic reticulum transmembrane protein n=1 Tax=Hevea brasiliensis TaxID=3981 RepID=A0A6A6MPU2_HEVBR|nr:hypothetical protein GH714_024045 [Hevea brasiliensis]